MASHGLWTYLLRNAKKRARRRDQRMTLTLPQVKAILARGRCCYCGTPVGSRAGKTAEDSATLDVLDPGAGYVWENTVLACHSCNTRKGDWTPRELRELARRIEDVAAAHAASCANTVA